MSILLTGGTGFIGSHTSVELVKSGYNIIIVDNLSNSKRDVIEKISSITGKNIKFYEADITNEDSVDEIFKTNKIKCVIHFAAFKSVGESVSNPLKYYHNNINGLLILLKVMKKYNVNNIVFSSSATVYGDGNTLPINETAKLNPLNPYGRTKLMGENIIKDYINSSENGKCVILRYFNPVGAHKSGLIGENPNGKPNNLFPYILDVAKGIREKLYIFGNDYNTPDGTGIRDYIHVVDLAKGHVSSVEYMLDNNNSEKVSIYNLGTGKGYSVLNVVECFNSEIEKYFGLNPITYEFTEKRPGDSSEIYADSTLAEDNLGWTCKYDLKEMVKSSLHFLVKFK